MLAGLDVAICGAGSHDKLVTEVRIRTAGEFSV